MRPLIGKSGKPGYLPSSSSYLRCGLPNFCSAVSKCPGQKGIDGSDEIFESRARTQRFALAAVSGRPLQKSRMKSSGVRLLSCSAFRGSDPFTAAVSIRHRQVAAHLHEMIDGKKHKARGAYKNTEHRPLSMLRGTRFSLCALNR